MQYEHILAEDKDGVATVTLNRPEHLNAWTWRMALEVRHSIAAYDARDDVRVIVVTGAGRAFSAGADLKAGFEANPTGAPDVRTRLRETYHPLILRMRTIPKPVIAAVNGPAVGIGCSFALAADLVVAARSAYFLLAFVNIGLGLDGGASQSLVARVGSARAFEIAYLGERITAERALGWNMINEVVDDDQLAQRVGELAARLAAGPPGSYATIKRTINDQAYAEFNRLLDLEADQQQQRAESNDFREGVLAFIQKRQANFDGS